MIRQHQIGKLGRFVQETAEGDDKIHPIESFRPTRAAVGAFEQRVGIVEEEDLHRVALADTVGDSLVGVTGQGEESSCPIHPFGPPTPFGHGVGGQVRPTGTGRVALDQQAAGGFDVAHQGVEGVDRHGSVQPVGATVEQPTLAGNQGDRGAVGGELTCQPGDGASGDAGDCGGCLQVVVLQYQGLEACVLNASLVLPVFVAERVVLHKILIHHPRGDDDVGHAQGQGGVRAGPDGDPFVGLGAAHALPGVYNHHFAALGASAPHVGLAGDEALDGPTSFEYAGAKGEQVIRVLQIVGHQVVDTLGEQVSQFRGFDVQTVMGHGVG